MRLMFKKAAILGGLSVSLLSTSAFAGGCFPGPAGPVCNPGVVTHPGPAPVMDPVHVFSQSPMGHLKTVQYLSTPSVNITRIHGVPNAPQLSDAPNGFTSGCMPESTGYCRGAAPVMAQPAPIMSQAAPAFVQPAPVIAPPAPQVTERVVAIGGGYDPSKFTPRTYGSNELTPGIAHIPTSIVDRSVENATAVLNSGKTQPQAIASGGTVPTPSMISSVKMSPPTPVMGGNIVGTVSNTVTMAPQTNVYPGSMSTDGTYYEKVSGPTMVGGMQATQVICRRQAPQMNVQSPIVGVPTPMPTPVCETVPAPMAPALPMMAPMAAPMAAQSPVPIYAPSAGGRYGSGYSKSSGGGSTRYGH